MTQKQQNVYGTKAAIYAAQKNPTINPAQEQQF
jgi:hypothetical protein